MVNLASYDSLYKSNNFKVSRAKERNDYDQASLGYGGYNYVPLLNCVCISRDCNILTHGPMSASNKYNTFSFFLHFWK